MDNKPKIIIIAVVVAVVLAGIYFWYWQNEKAGQTNNQTPGLGGQIYNVASSINGKVPETNPFKANSNPFTGVETNPLKQIIKNPF